MNRLYSDDPNFGFAELRLSNIIYSFLLYQNNSDKSTFKFFQSLSLSSIKVYDFWISNPSPFIYGLIHNFLP